MTDINLGRPGLSILPLGVGDAFSVIHHPTSMLVSRYQTPAWDNDLILIDVPQSIRKMMKEADDGRFHGLDLNRVGTLILTHLHTDHASGLETIAAFFKIALGRKLRLLALPEVLEGVPDFLKSLGSLGKMEDFFDVVPFPTNEDGTPGGISLGEGANHFLIEARKTNHTIPTAALRILHNKKRFSYSCDTSFDAELWDWLWDKAPSLVIHEVGHGIHTNYDELWEATKKGWGSGHRLAETPDEWRAATELRCKKMRLIHYPDDMLPFLETGPYPLAREGELIVL